MSIWLRLSSGCALATLISGCAFSHPDPASLARLLVSKGRGAEAADELEVDVRKHPDNVNERRLLIRVYASMGRLDRAQQHARALAQILGAASPIPWVELGYALELTHRYDEALVQYDHAAEVAPHDALGPLTGGLRAARWGELGLAEPRLMQALQRDPQNAEGWHALGLVRVQSGDLDGANDAYSAGLRADPRAVEDHVGLATVALLRGNAALALSEYDAIVSARPRLGDAQLGRAWALVKLGRLDDAQRALNHARELGASPRPLLAQERALRELQRSNAPPSMH
jgi:tetratricopeptide (TPR) repeat protein